MGVTFTENSAKRIGKTVRWAESQASCINDRGDPKLDGNNYRLPFAVFVFHNGTNWRTHVNAGYADIIGDGQAPGLLAANEWNSPAASEWLYIRWRYSTPSVAGAWLDSGVIQHNSSIATDDQTNRVVPIAYVEYSSGAYIIRQCRHFIEIYDLVNCAGT
jgi:hypothetical protein